MLLSLALLGLAGLCLIDPHFAKGYLIDIFSAPIFFGALIAAFIFMQVRKRLPALISVIATIVLGLSLGPQVFPAQPSPAKDAQPVRMIFANLWIKNQTPARLLDWVEAENPDIVAVVEAGPLANATLAASLEKRYPHVVRRYDTLIFSRYPLSKGRPRPVGYSLITTEVSAPSGKFTLAVAHLTRPWPFTAPDDQPAQFNRLAADLKDETPEDIVLVGDFNTTPSASAMRDFSHEVGLTPAAAPVGTWPAVLPGMFRVGIDNILAGKKLSLQHRKAGPYYGSDHRPVRVDIYPSR
ncbi:endonuclease/exonuclease/phosphatase family protein [Asticcacaulis sp. BYS171W]|uniref:Endonuclease/exonuclease/phosphatase family protein n=1 Tax=Asticcacaulis aquaticus TaxID=2984212 RepID=A0ABT5HV56_9CAUL|nr:endonuclease/exonuclease/phosphatase family protein [Asticcacaulis aquaticus]MDC7683859.1 endonuclease/exonuclease/phosphatase family protein [Asticcacaulis aquaticus]